MVKKLLIGLLLVIFGGIVLHAPLTVAFSTLFPNYELFIKSWKEVLLGVALVVAIIAVTKAKAWAMYKTPIFLCIAVFAALNIALIPLFYSGFEATVAALFINLRYLLFFVLVYTAVALYPRSARLFFWTFIVGAMVVLVFALLQATILPHDVLKYLGYSEATIMPFLTVDQNMDYIRINSTLRGPNPLGAYAMVVLVVLLAFWLRGPNKLTRTQIWIMGILTVGGLVAMWASYSRSAALGLVVAAGLVLLVVFGRKFTKGIWVALAIAALLVGGSLVAFRETPFISNVILHEDPGEGNDVNSNDGHAESLVDGATRMVQQPFGGGVGSTGSASLLSDSPLIIENQYLYVAHETGWLGLGLFIAISLLVLLALWKRRTEWFALGVFASGAGLMLIGMIQPVWVDDTVAIIWWGLAALALAIPRGSAILLDTANGIKTSKNQHNE